MARATRALVAIFVSAHVHAAGGHAPGEPCDVLVGSQCVRLTGEWDASERGRGDAAGVFEVSKKLRLAPHSEGMTALPFQIEVSRATGSTTSIEGTFQVKGGLAMYVGNGASDSSSKCTIVVVPKSPALVSVTSFGDCQEGARTSPDGAYRKLNSTAVLK